MSAEAVPRLHDPRPTGVVVSVSRSPRHRFSKDVLDVVTLVEGHGVEGDAHAGATAQHRSVRRWRPSTPNLRQVHLLHTELLDDLRARGFAVGPGDVGENVLLRGVDLLALPTGSLVQLGDAAVVEVTGLRNPCVQLERFADGLMTAVLRTEPDGTLSRLAGVMSVVRLGGHVHVGDPVRVRLPDGDPVPLRPV